MNKGGEGGAKREIFLYGGGGKWRRSLRRVQRLSNAKIRASNNYVRRHWTVRAASRFARKNSRRRVRSGPFSSSSEKASAHDQEPKGRSGSMRVESDQSYVNLVPDVGTKFARTGCSSGDEEKRGKGARMRTFLLILMLLRLLSNLVTW